MFSRTPTHPLWQTRSRSLSPSVPRIQPSGLEANHMLALLLASSAKSTQQQQHSSSGGGGSRSSSSSSRGRPRSESLLGSGENPYMFARRSLCSFTVFTLLTKLGLFSDGVNCQIKVKQNFFLLQIKFHFQITQAHIRHAGICLRNRNR